MFPWNSRRTRRVGRDRFRPGQSAGLVATVEGLEARQLLAFSVLGQSLPDLTITGYASTAASWGGPVTVTVNVRNLGASTIIEPLALDTNATSSADAPASTVGVFAVRNPRSLRGAVEVGAVSLPPIRQNSFLQQTSTFILPPQPLGFPGNGGKVYLVFKANATGTVAESDTTNNVSKPVPLLIEAPLPDLEAVGLDLPPVMQPGDVVQANVRIANFGPADTAAQGPVYVALVASRTPNFVVGSSQVIALVTLANIPGIQNTATRGPVFADSNQTPQQNVVTFGFPPTMLPGAGFARKYYIGVVVDPTNNLKQLSTLSNSGGRKEPFSLIQRVGPPIVGLPPAGVLVPGATIPVFPFPLGDKLVGGSLDGSSFPAVYPPVALGSPSAGTITAASFLTQSTPSGISAARFSSAASNGRAVAAGLRRVGNLA